MGFLDDSLTKHLRQVQGPTPEELKLREEVAKLTSALRSTAVDLSMCRKELQDAVSRHRTPVDPKTVFGRLIELSESRSSYDQTVTFAMKMDVRMMAPTERHEREMIAREVAAYVEQEILRCRVVDSQQQSSVIGHRRLTMQNPYVTPDQMSKMFWSKDHDE